MTTKAKPLVSSALLARGFGGRGADFEIYTAAAVADETTDLPIVRMVGSSTVKDLQGDIMTLTALQDMANGSPDLTIFLNHEYRVPDDVFGKLYGKPEIRMAGSIADLHLAAVADLSRDEPGRYPHSKAYDTYTQIKKGKIKLGSSVGCQVTQYQFLDPDDFFSGILIEHVIWVEHSVVGVPASQRAWVEQAVKGLFERSLVEGDADEARRLAPAMKSLWDGPYDTILREIESEGLRRDLARTRARGTGPQRILFDFVQNGFVLAGPRSAKKSLTLEDVDDLLTQPQEMLLTGGVEDDGLDSTKTASGKISWPLMDIKTEWTGSKAEKQIFDWARNDQDEIVASKARQCFLWHNPDESDKQSGYKFPFCYISGNSPKIVPLGVRACANILHGGMGGTTVSSEDQGGMRAKCKTMYGRINSEFHPDPEWVVPWEKKESDKSIEDDRVMIAEKLYGYQEDGSFLIIEKEIADSESDAALNRQDLGEIPINEDGTHEPMTGIHSHPHTDGHGASHEHEHPHNNDANHSEHSHQETKEASIGCGCCARCTGKDDCACCDACAMNKTARASEGRPAEKNLVATPEQMALLGVYNTIGKQLGFPEHSLTTKCDLVPSASDATVVRTMLSALDDVSDALIVMAQRNDYYVDSLMQAMGVPDVNDADMGDGDAESGATMALLSAMRPALTKDGREISSKNRNHLQNIHDEVMAMHPDACKGVTGDGTAHQDGSVTVEEAQAEARQMGQGDSYSNLASLIAETTKAVMLKVFEGFDAKSLVEASVKKAVDTAMSTARANLDVLQHEQVLLMEQIGKLTNMPLGRPTSLQRNVTPASPYAINNTVTYEEMLEVAGISTRSQQTLQDALAQTSIVEVPIMRGNEEIRTKYRRWPSGVGGAVGEGTRPPLTASQKTLMHYLDWGTYNTGGAADVPLVDDPAERLL